MAGFTRKEDSELVVRRKIEKAKRVLDIRPDYVPVNWEGCIKAKYALLVKSLHPDASGAVRTYPYTLEEIRQAKDYLLKKLEELKDD